MLTNPLILAAALEGLELKLARVNAMITEISGRRPGKAKKAATMPSTRVPDRKKRQLSPAARQRMAQAQKRRWSEARKAKG